MATSSTLAMKTSSSTPRRRRWWAWLTLIPFLSFAGFLLAVRVLLPRAITYAPASDNPTPYSDDDAERDAARARVDLQFRVNVGPPAATLAVWVLESRQQARGTVLVLHGIRDRKEPMLGLGRELAAEGYRAVLPDLRGHGRSSGGRLTYGVVESADLEEVVRALEARGRGAPSLGVYGASYGGAVGLQYAAREPRVRAVIAVSTFTSLREVTPVYVRKFIPLLGRTIPGELINAAVDAAGRDAGFDPDRASPLDAITQTRAAPLLIHGRTDLNISWRHSQRLYEAAANPDKRLLLLDGEDHDSIMADREGVIRRETLAWLARHLGRPRRD